MSSPGSGWLPADPARRQEVAPRQMAVWFTIGLLVIGACFAGNAWLHRTACVGKTVACFIMVREE